MKSGFWAGSLARLFDFLLACDAVPGPGHGLQSPEIDVVSAREAQAKTAVSDSPQSVLDHLQHLVLLGALPEQEIFVVRARGAIHHVGRHNIVNRTSALLFLSDALTQFPAAGFQLACKLLHRFLSMTQTRSCDHSTETYAVAGGSWPGIPLRVHHRK
jgi:hypothetical protein